MYIVHKEETIYSICEWYNAGLNEGQWKINLKSETPRIAQKTVQETATNFSEVTSYQNYFLHTYKIQLFYSHFIPTENTERKKKSEARQVK